MHYLSAIPDWIKLVGGIIGLLTTVVGLTVYFTRLKLEGARKLKDAEGQINQQRSTIGALESSVQALSQSVALMREGKDQAATILMDVKRLVSEGRHAVLAAGDSILIRDPYSSDSLVFLTVEGEAAEKIKHLRIPIQSSVAGRVLSSGEASVYTAGTAQERYEGADVKSTFRSDSILTLPLVHGGTAVGVLQFVNRIDGGAFTRTELELVRALSDEIAYRVKRLVDDTSSLKMLGIVQRAEITEGSFMFLDLTRSGSLFEALPAEEVMLLLNEYFDRLIGRALRDGVMLDRLLGDGMLLRVNVPKQLPDFPTVAIRCALGLQSEFYALRAEWLRIGRPAAALDHRIGIATGPVTAGLMGHPQFLSYTVLGTPVNRAARLCEAARSTESGIAICDSTYQRASQHLRDVATFKQLDGATAAYEVRPIVGTALHQATPVPAGSF